jgi:hypothetical protein
MVPNYKNQKTEPNKPTYKKGQMKVNKPTLDKIQHIKWYLIITTNI